MGNNFAEDVVGIGLNSQSLVSEEDGSSWVIDWYSVNINDLLGSRLSLERPIIHADHSLCLKVLLYPMIVILKPFIVKLLLVNLLFDAGLGASISNKWRD